MLKPTIILYGHVSEEELEAFKSKLDHVKSRFFETFSIYFVSSSESLKSEVVDVGFEFIKINSEETNIELTFNDDDLKDLFLLSKAVDHLLDTDNEKLCCISHWKSERLFDTFHSSLPKEYLYLGYGENVDLEYNYRWVAGSSKLLREFGSLYDYIVDSASSESSYYNSVFSLNVPQVSKRIKYHNRLEDNFKALLNVYLSIPFNKKLKSPKSFITRKIFGLNLKIRNYVSRGKYTCENSKELIYFEGFHLNVIEKNIGSILKCFIYDKQIRNKVRFLDRFDFENIDKI